MMSEATINARPITMAWLRLFMIVLTTSRRCREQLEAEPDVVDARVADHGL